MLPNKYPVTGAGLGLRRDLMYKIEDRPPQQVNFIEVAPENWIGVGGRLGKRFKSFTERYPFVTHRLSLSLGGPTPLDEALVLAIKQFLDTHMEEISFITAVLEEADCDLLLDVNNIYVNSINHQKSSLKNSNILIRNG